MAAEDRSYCSKIWLTFTVEYFAERSEEEDRGISPPYSGHAVFLLGRFTGATSLGEFRCLSRTRGPLL